MARLGDHPQHRHGVRRRRRERRAVHRLGADAGRIGVRRARARPTMHRLPIDDALRIGEQVALALEHAHERGVVHRDLKPANVWLAADGTARLGDFGLAVEADRSRITSEGMVVGTVAYLAPEQAVGRAPDARSDLYALGAIALRDAHRPAAVPRRRRGRRHLAAPEHRAGRAHVAQRRRCRRRSRRSCSRCSRRIPAARPADAGSGRGRAPSPAGRRTRRLGRDAAAENTLAPVTQAASFGRFVGRAEELDRSKALFDETLSGKGRLVMVVGRAGHRQDAPHRGARACTPPCAARRCAGATATRASSACRTSRSSRRLRTYVRDRSDDELRAELSTGAPEVATLVSELRVRFPDLPVSPPLDGDAERLRLFEGVVGVPRQRRGARGRSC